MSYFGRPPALRIEGRVSGGGGGRRIEGRARVPPAASAGSRGARVAPAMAGVGRADARPRTRRTPKRKETCAERKRLRTRRKEGGKGIRN